MNGVPANAAVIVPRWRKAISRIAGLLVAAVLIGVVIHIASAAMQRSETPAGFGQGLVQGALMPAALPNLLVGNDVVIYAESNNGVSYKLGYTLGVNACGAMFFGFAFWRLNRWRKGGKQESEPSEG